MSQDKPEDEREPMPSSPPPKVIKPTKPKPSKAQKRSSADDEDEKPARKRKKKSTPEPESESDPEDTRASSPEPPKKVEESRSKPTKHKAAVKPKAANGRGRIDKLIQEDDNESSALSDPPSDLEPPNTHQARSAAKAEDSDSELSELLDEDPKPKKKRKSAEAAEGKPQKTKAAKPKNDADMDPDDAEIKRLQGWLVKCGIRKLWGKELKPYEGSKAKTKHLRSMLADVGMTGRYSIEKATQIKEARELAADIEAVQEGAERWGKDKDKDEPEDDGESRGQRRLVRGAKAYDFLSSNGEETD